VARQASAPDAERRNDDAVRRIRDESARRIEGQRRRRACSSWCALATLAGGISLATLDAQERRLDERGPFAVAAEAQVREQARFAADEEARRARAAEACARRDMTLAAIDEGAERALARVRSDERRGNIRIDALERAMRVIDDAASAGCDAPVTPTHAF